MPELQRSRCNKEKHMDTNVILSHLTVFAQTNQVILNWLFTPVGLIYCRMLTPMVVGEAVGTFAYLYDRSRPGQPQNQYRTDLIRYTGNIIFSVFVTCAFPDGWTWMQIIAVGIGFGALSIFCHLGFRLLWRMVVKPWLQKKFPGVKIPDSVTSGEIKA